jgi:enoyl-CoA hydratase
MELKTVGYEVTDNIARVTMNRPEKMNAINHELWDDLFTAFDQAEQDRNVRVVILAGSGKAFSSGWDMKSGPYFSVPEGYDKWGTGNALATLQGISDRYRKLFNLRKVTIAQVSGYCLAAGCYLQMLCDLAVASEDAMFGHPATGGGGVDSMPLWVWLLGARKAKELLMTRRMIDGREAERIGLVNRAVPADRLEEETLKLAREIATVPSEDPGPGGHGMSLLKENINTDLEIMGLSALFSYHRQLNAWGHANLSRDDD